MNIAKIAHGLRNQSVSSLKKKTWKKGDSYRRPSGSSPLSIAAQEGGCTQKALMEEIERQNAIREARRAARPSFIQAPLYHLHVQGEQTQPFGRFASYLKRLAVEACPSSDTGDQFIHIVDAHIIDYDRKQRLWLLSASGWCKYSSRAGTWHRSGAWLAGHDPDQPSGYFCRRVPASCSTVTDALVWLQPAEVKKALAEGRKVIRQGDVYLIEMKRGDNLSALPRNHTWNRDTRAVEHPEHGPIHVPYPVKAVPQKTLNGFRD